MNRKVYLIAIPALIMIAGIFYFSRSNVNSTIPDQIDYSFHIRPIFSDKCFACHGPDANKRKAELRLDTPDGPYALSGETLLHIVQPGKPDESELFHRITSTDTSQRMPPASSSLKLSQLEVDIIKKWIDQGAEYKPHWAFSKPVRGNLPPENSWSTKEIDRYIFAKLNLVGLEPNDRADPERLLKRLSFDLTGLPPSIEDQDHFLQDYSDESYEVMADKYLSSVHYGERMAIGWMDIARYADSHGYQDDGLRTMWPWRDWVIHAFNENYPYDKFVKMQLAGDLMPDGTKEDLLATGFNRNHKITQEGGVIDEEYRVEYVTDRTNTFGKAFLGMTFECAKCHDHKFDPISAQEYYSTFAFFDLVPEKGLFGDISVASLADPPSMQISDEDIADLLYFINKKDTGDVSVMIMKDSVGIRDTYLLTRGNYDGKGEIVTPSTPDQIMVFSEEFEKNRLGLSEWIVDEDNPLTARVFVNRIWKQYFNRGIVASLGDFGMQGTLPSHPKLLDWLAVDFRENGWDIKRLIRQMVLSETYKQSSQLYDKKVKKDPENIYLSRMPRARFNAEIIRDLVLASSGLLNREIGGPSVKPYQPEGLWDAATSGRGILKAYIQDHGDDLYRRGLYTFIKRTVPPPSMLMFDASNRDQCEVDRTSTNTPLQALVLLNDPTVLEASRVMAERLILNTDENDRIEMAFRLIMCRKIKDKEFESINEYFKNKLLSLDNAIASELIDVGEYPLNEELDPTEVAALMQTILIIYNLEEATSLG